MHLRNHYRIMLTSSWQIDVLMGLFLFTAIAVALAQQTLP